MITKEEFAKQLNGVERGSALFMSNEQRIFAKENRLVVCYGESDDLLEIEGAINDEVAAYDGGYALLCHKPFKKEKIGVISEGAIKEINSLLDDNDLPDLDIKTVKIEVEWHDESYPTWIIKTDLPHATFETLEDGDIFCRGIVLSMDDIEKEILGYSTADKDDFIF